LFVEIGIFSIDFGNIFQVSSLMEIRPVGAELSYGGWRTDRRDENCSRSTQFCERA